MAHIMPLIQQQNSPSEDSSREFSARGSVIPPPVLPQQQQEENHQQPQQQLYQTTPLRFVALFEYSLLAFNNGVQWILFANIVDEATEFFHMSNYQLDWLSTCFYIMFLVTAFPTLVMFDKYGVRPSLLVASSLNLLGGLIKILVAAVPGLRESFALLLVSQCVTGSAQSFFLPVPPALSNVWFAEKERTVATAIAAISNPLGGAAGMIVTTLFVNSENKDTAAFLKLFGFVTALNLLDFILLIFVVGDRPQQPPSEAALIRQNLTERSADVSITDRLKKVFSEIVPHITNWGTVLLLLGGGIGGGLFWTLTTLIAQISQPFGVSQRLVGLMGLFNNVFGIPVGILVSSYVDKRRIYKTPLIITLIAIILLSVLYTILLKFEPDSANYHLAAIFIALGGPQNVVLPIAFEAAAETTFPLNENVCSTLVLCASELMAIIFMNILPHVLANDSFSKQTGSIVASLIMIGMNFIALICLIFGKVEMNRMNHAVAANAEQQNQDQNTNIDTQVQGAPTAIDDHDHDDHHFHANEKQTLIRSPK